MVDVPQSIKKKKRIRSMFSPEQSKLIRSKALPPSGSEKEVTSKEKDKTHLDHKKKPSSESEETYRFEIDLSCDREGDKYPEISFSQLVEAEQKSEDEEPEEDPDVKRMSEYFEDKYGGTGGTGGAGSKRRITDVNIDHGYDTSDPFVDDSEAFDEVIPDELDTQHGGFYINFGDLMFKKVTLSDSDEEPTKVQNRKRKRDEEDRKQLHKKMKSQKIKDKYKKIDKEVKLKKKKIIVDDDTTDSDSMEEPVKIKKPTVKEVKTKQSDKKQSDKTKETSSQNKSSKSSEVKTKKSEKKPPSEKKVAKKKSIDILEDERTKVLAIVEKHKPFGDDKLSLLADNLASIEFELRRNHSHSRRGFYENLIKKMGEDFSVGYTKLKNLAFSSLTKRNAAALEEALVPLKKLVSAIMADIQPSFEKKRAVYLEKMESWKTAQAEQKPGEELAKPKAPPKCFKWDDVTRIAYGKVIQVKFSQLKLIRVKTDEQTDLMKRYMKSLTEDVWSGGWMTANVLAREAQPYCKLFSNGKGPKKKPAVSANPLKTTAKPSKTKSESAPKQNSNSKQNSSSRSGPSDNVVSKSVPSEKVVSKFDAAFSEPPKSASSGTANSKTSKERPLSNNSSTSSTSKVANNSSTSITSKTDQSDKKEVQTLSPTPSKSVSFNKTGSSSTKSNSSKPSPVNPLKSKDFSADLAIIKSNINKINANLNKTVPSITITDKPSKSPSPTSSSSKPNKEVVSKVNPTKPQPKSAKTASDRPIVSVPAMFHLITPRTGSPVKLTSDHITPDFINNLLKKYGTERLQQIKNQGLFPALLKEELMQVKSNSNAVIIIDDDAASPQKTPPSTQKSSSKSNVTSSQSHVTSSKSNVTSSPSHVTSLKSHVTSHKPATSSPKPITSSPKTIMITSSSANNSSSASNQSGTAHTPLANSSSTISVIEKSSKQSISPLNERRTVSSLSYSRQTAPKQTIPVVSSPSPRTNPDNKTHNTTISTTSKIAKLTDSRPAVLITKSTLLAPPSAKQNVTSSTQKPGASNTPLQCRLSQLMNTPNVIKPLSQSLPNKPAVSRPVLCISKPASFPLSSSKPGSSNLSLSKGSSSGMSLGTILSQHPQIDSQTLNKSILKSVAAKLQSFKDSKEKE